MIGSLAHLTRAAAIRAILTGDEQLAEPLLDTVRIDHAAESATTAPAPADDQRRAHLDRRAGAPPAE